ncbi:MAG: efflux transporter outer membrane subunit [Magnetococcales bacterium]|nr:efflux transporter outer membrane subunit [Magnetococcales bacterium]NGZ28897.1 efflux transporter outer membrane subunit [Magnetococcales bacterium]
MKRLILPLLITLLTGCASDPSLPEVNPHIPANWSEESLQQDGQAMAQLPSWRTFFPHAPLQNLIEQALAENRDLRNALVRVKKAAAQTGVAESNRWPLVQGVVSHQDARTPADLNQNGKTSFTHRQDLLFNLPSYELDVWGRVDRMVEGAEERLLASEESWRAMRVVLMAMVVEGALAWREAVEHVTIANKLVENRRQVLELYQQRHGAGLTGQRQVAEATANLASSQAELADWQKQEKSTYHALALLVAANQPLNLEWPTLRELGLETPLQAGLPSQVLLQRPDIKAAEHQLLAAQGDVAAARANLFPRITLTASGGVASRDLAGLFAGGSGVWTFLPMITLPIFDLPRRQLDITVMEAEQEMAQNTYEKAIQQGFREVAESLSVQTLLQDRLQATTEGVKQRYIKLGQARDRFQNGLDGRLELLETEKEFLQAHHPWLTAQRHHLSGRVQLFKVLGGGQEETTREIKEDDL